MGKISFGDFAQAFSGVPGALEYTMYRKNKEGNGYVPGGPNTAPPTTANDILLADSLKSPLGNINTQGQNNLASELGRLGNQAQVSSLASGRPVGQYQGQALGRANTLASRGISDSVAGQLGGASLKDYQNQKEYEANVALAREIGALNSPSQLQELMSALSYGGKAAGEGKGIYDAFSNKNRGSTGYRGVPEAYTYGGSERYV